MPGLPEGLSQEEFFQGFSVPRNKELMRVFKDLGMVEQLGSGVPRILESYGRECFTFSDHFLRMSFPVHESMIPQVTPQVKSLIFSMSGEMTCLEMQEKLNLVEMTIPAFDGIVGLPEVFPGWEIAVIAYFNALGGEAVYEYDYGDGWLHTVKLEGYMFREKGIKYPIC